MPSKEGKLPSEAYFPKCIVGTFGDSLLNERQRPVVNACLTVIWVLRLWIG